VNVFYHVLAFIPFTAPVAKPALVAVEAAPARHQGPPGHANRQLIRIVP
jgi:hypothetical protein